MLINANRAGVIINAVRGKKKEGNSVNLRNLCQWMCLLGMKLFLPFLLWPLGRVCCSLGLSMSSIVKSVYRRNLQIPRTTASKVQCFCGLGFQYQGTQAHPLQPHLCVTQVIAICTSSRCRRNSGVTGTVNARTICNMMNSR